jgi:hypothetical protein
MSWDGILTAYYGVIYFAALGFFGIYSKMKF